MKDNMLITASKQFAVDSINACSGIQKSAVADIIVKQFVRSATSIGANIHEGNYAASRADFINKFQIALKECYETEYWLDIFRDTSIMASEKCDILKASCSKIRKMLSASIKTAKSSE